MNEDTLFLSSECILLILYVKVSQRTCILLFRIMFGFKNTPKYILFKYMTQLAQWISPLSGLHLIDHLEVVSSTYCVIEGSSRGGTDKMVRCRWWTGTLQNPMKCLWRWSQTIDKPSSFSRLHIYMYVPSQILLKYC